MATLRTALQDLLQGRDKFVEGAMTIERGLLNELAEAKQRYQTSISNENSMCQKAIEDGEKWTEQVRQLEGERETYRTRCEISRSEMDSTKSEVKKLQQANTEQTVALALLQSELDRSNKERDVALARAELAEAAKDEAVKEAVAKVTSDMDGQSLSDLKVECEELRSRLNVKRMIEEEICKLLDVNIDLVDFATTNGDDDHADKCEEDHDSTAGAEGKAKTSYLNTIKRRLDEYQRFVIMKEDAETKLKSCVAELQKIKADYQVSMIRLSTEYNRFKHPFTASFETRTTQNSSRWSLWRRKSVA